MVQASTLAKWRAIVARHDSSGMSIRDFAESEGLNPKTLSWWRWRVGQAAGAGTAVTFTEVAVTEPAESTVVLVLEQLDAHVVVDRDTDLGLLRDVLLALS